MGSDEEEFYDTIDDIQSGEDRDLCNHKCRNEYSQLDKFDFKKLKEIHTPFYNRQIGKTEINSSKNDWKSGTVTATKKTRLNGRMQPISLVSQKKNRSYLTMFYARNGQSVKSEATSSNRVACLELPSRSNLCSRLNNRFMKHQSSEKSTKLAALEPITDQKCEFEASLRSNFFTGSEGPFNFYITPRERPKRDTNKLKSKPVKGRNLRGPNITPEKLELLRRGQDYGNAASERNRIKLSENKLAR
ncbi:uncharacterized protein [Euwallacea fornicatus]|uniref:uncharacterized protein n=1 Tax=Euwallacea fornicatus TaxID=995702 RepID=UPI00338FC7D5